MVGLLERVFIQVWLRHAFDHVSAVFVKFLVHGDCDDVSYFCGGKSAYEPSQLA